MSIVAIRGRAFFLSVWRPPSSTLFPYTTLFRSAPTPWPSTACCSTSSTTSARPKIGRHTSELQSLAYLVCRLLLEKKKDHAHRLEPQARDPLARLDRRVARAHATLRDPLLPRLG